VFNANSQNLTFVFLAALVGFGAGYFLWGRRASRRQIDIDALNRNLNEERATHALAIAEQSAGNAAVSADSAELAQKNQTLAAALLKRDEADAADSIEKNTELLHLKARLEDLQPLEARVCELTLALATKDLELAAAHAALARSSPDQVAQADQLGAPASKALSFAAAAGSASISSQAPPFDAPSFSSSASVSSESPEVIPSALSTSFEDDSSNPETALPESLREPDFLGFEPRRTRPSSILLSTREAELRHLRETLDLLLGPLAPELVAPLAAEMRTGSALEDWLLAERTIRSERLERLRAERGGTESLY
jgi:hypothetical protein